MNILYNIKSIHSIGGIEASLISKANYLTDVYGFDVTIAVTDDCDKKTAWTISNKIKIVKLAVNYNGIQGNFANKFYLKIIKFCVHIKLLIETIKRYNFDLIISEGYEDKWILPFIKNNEKIIRECHFHRYFMYNNNRTLIRRIHTNIERWLCSKYDKLVVLTEKDRLQWKLENAVVIPNFSRFTNILVKSDLQNPVVLAVGRLENQKGFDKLLDIWRKVSTMQAFDKKWKLVVAGTGSQYTNLQKKVLDLQLGESVYFAGLVQDMDKIYRSVSILVCTSRQEGFPLFIIEAFNYGIPCVSFDCPMGPSDIIQNDTGFLVPDDDYDSFSEKLLLLMNDDELRGNMGTNACRRAEDVFSITKIMEKWKSLFDELK